MKPTSRCLLLLVAFLSFAAVGVALISQYAFSLQPCAWCSMQRLIYLVLGAFALVGALMPGQGVSRRIAAAIAALLGIAGVIAAWYQHSVAAQMFSCDRTFADRLMVDSGLEEGITWLFGIYASCMDATAYIFGIEYAIWSLVLFALMTLALVWSIFKRH
ncbi:disulfide bond formation protein B [Kerstersia gyiorum]|uniref:disulfide bond formation protein B n=1 Tax=Kerstersia gyiorum TaxID=206506 RepID=UPI003B42FAB2